MKKSRMAASAVRSAKCWWQWSFHADGTEAFTSSPHCKTIWKWRELSRKNHRFN